MLVSIVAPSRNEINFIDSFLISALNQKANFQFELIVADGMSDDGTRLKLDEWVERDTRVKIVDNPGRIVSTGLNKAVSVAKGEIIIRMDIHTTYSQDYITECVRSLQETDANCVGGPWRAIGSTLKQKSIANSFQSRFGSGGAVSRNINYTGPVDTVYLGAWRKDYLIRIGGFDEDLIRNQDDELCLRIKRNGGAIWQSSSIKSTYTPRNSFAALFKQFHQYGYWKTLVIKKHSMPASLRHLAPFLFVSLFFSSGLLAFFSTTFLLAFFLITLLYTFATFIFAWSVRGNTGLIGAIYSLLSFWSMHFGYGIGFARGVLDFIILNHGPRNSMGNITR